MALGDIIDAVSAQITNTHFDVRVGVFGEQGAGKTTLLAAYYGNQRSDSWAEKHGYSLLAEDPGQGRQISANYFGLVKDKTFPPGSFDFTEYRFSFDIRDPQNPHNPLSCLRICWYDYPGKWWTDKPSDVGERVTREAALHKLLTCHVGILLFDGVSVSKEGHPYLQTLLASFRDQVSRHRAEMQLQNRVSVYPTQWILALTKADVFDERFSAQDFKHLLEKKAGVELDELGRIIGKTLPYRWTYLLLSSARGQGNQVESVERPLGLELIVPLALLSSVEKVGRVTLPKRIQSIGMSGILLTMGADLF